MEGYPASALDEDEEYPSAPRRRTRSRRRAGRRIVLLLMGLLWSAFASCYWLTTQIDPRADVGKLRAGIIIAALWTTALFIAVLLRHNWARTILIPLLGLLVFLKIVGMSVALTSTARGDVHIYFFPFAIVTYDLCVDISALLALIYSRKVRYLTSPRAKRCDFDFH